LTCFDSQLETPDPKSLMHELEYLLLLSLKNNYQN
jgi:hypothetical protein